MKGYRKDCAGSHREHEYDGLYCHRHAPTPVDDAGTAPWPAVNEFDWCLEHTPKPNSPDKANNDPVDGDKSAEVAK